MTNGNRVPPHRSGERLRLAGVAGEDLAALGKAAGVEHQRQRHQHAIGALLLGPAERGIGICAAAPLEIRIGEIVERDHLIEIKQAALLAKQKSLQGILVLEQLIGDTVQRHQVQVHEIKADQLPQAAALLQPLMGCHLTARYHHARDNRADRRRQLPLIKAQCAQLLIQTDLA